MYIRQRYSRLRRYTGATSSRRSASCCRTRPPPCCAPTSYTRSTSGTSSAGSAPRRKTLQVQLGHAPVHEIGHDARRCAGHGPAHVAVAAVEEEVAVAAQAEDGRTVGGHGPEAGAVLAALVVHSVGEDVAGEAQDVVEVARRPAPVVAGELRRRGEAELIAEPRPPDQPLLVDPGEGGGKPAAPQGEGRGVTLGGIDRQAHAGRARHDGAAHAEGQDVGVRGVALAVAAEGRLDAVAPGQERGDAGAQPDADPEAIAAEGAQPLREESRVAARIAEVADGSGDLGLDRLEDRIDLGHVVGVEDLLLLAVLGEEGHLLHPRLELGVIAVEVQRAPGDGVVLDALCAREVVEDALAILAEAELDQRVASRPRRRALPQKAESP